MNIIWNEVILQDSDYGEILEGLVKVRGVTQPLAAALLDG